MRKRNYQKKDYKKNIFPANRDEAIRLLAEYSEIKRKSGVSYRKRRERFNKTKWRFYKRWLVCGACKEKPVNHIHHIIQLKNGGDNHKYNLIGLCELCHWIIHPWMKPLIV